MSTLSLPSLSEVATCDARPISESQADYRRSRQAAFKRPRQQPYVFADGSKFLPDVPAEQQALLFAETHLSRTEYARRSVEHGIFMAPAVAPSVPCVYERPPADYTLLRRQIPVASAQSTGAAGALGTNAKCGSALATQPPDFFVALGDVAPTDHKVRQYALQNAARILMPDDRVSNCLRTVTHGRTNVEIWHLPETKTARFGGLQTCASVWMCPCCASRISERRRIELSNAVAGWKGAVVMVTYTVRHDESMSLQETLDGLKRARRLATSGRAWMRFKSDHGVAGSVRAVEITHGANGWHPHIHELLFLRSREIDGKALREMIASRWASAVDRAGLRSVNEHGCSVQLANEAVADYIAKFGSSPSWTVEHEITKQVSKGGRTENRAPSQLLGDYAFKLDGGAGALWQEYARTMRGQRQLFWSRGLREELGLREEVSDAELIEEVQARGVVINLLTLAEWRVVVANDSRAELLAVAATGDSGAVSQFVADLMGDCCLIGDIMGASDDPRGG